jgi:hypothetical protein
MRLSLKDYKSILKYYKIDNSTMKSKDIKKQAEHILSEKLCRCIKKINTPTESTAIAICKKSILTRKNLKISKFKCKGSAKFIPNNSLVKTKKIVNIHR